MYYLIREHNLTAYSKYLWTHNDFKNGYNDLRNTLVLVMPSSHDGFTNQQEKLKQKTKITYGYNKPSTVY